MTKRMVLMLVIAGLIVGGIFGFQAFKSRMIKKYLSSQGVPPQTVSTTKAGFKEWQPELNAVGTLRAVRGADLAPEVSGVISAIHFRSGDEVKAGTPLVQLNAAADIAQLESLKAAADLAQLTYERDKRQLKVQAVSQATVDTDAANLEGATARGAAQQPAEAFLLLAVIVLGPGVAGALAGLGEGIDQRILILAGLGRERALAAAP